MPSQPQNPDRVVLTTKFGQTQKPGGANGVDGNGRSYIVSDTMLPTAPGAPIRRCQRGR